MQKLYRYYWLYFIISLLVIVPGIVVGIQHGLNLGIDFTGGSLVELSFPANRVPSNEVIEQATFDLTEVESIQRSGQSNLIVRTQPLKNEVKEKIIENISKTESGVKEVRFESIGPTLGRELVVKTLVAVGLVAVVILLFLMRQFNEAQYGISAVLAMFHDTLVLISTFILLGHYHGAQIDVLFVTAVLTTLSFSVHDTIVTFDRIRELKRTQPGKTLKDHATQAVIQTITRSLNNSLTIIIMLLTLVLMGGETLRWFAVALLIGSITGTYSSIFTAVPLLLAGNDIKNGLKKKK